jgi:crossover junction endodeoxyribonuclease RuvC
MIILGIDPGSRYTGYGVIEVGVAPDRVLEFGVLRIAATDDPHLRLHEIYNRIGEVIGRHLPDECAVEMPIYGKNAQSMLKLGRAQAAAILAAMNRQLPVSQYTPKEIKKSVTGNGAASKEQVRYMVCTLLSIDDGDKMGLDSSDALAIGLCHAHRRNAVNPGVSKSWDVFVKENPDRLVK